MNWNLKVLIIILFFFILISNSFNVQSAPPIAENTIIVDQNGNGDYTSIKEAINNSEPTNIILIKEGIYKENNIIVKNKITIIGDNPETTIVDCEGNNGFILSSTYIDIENIQIINSNEYAIDVQPGSDSCSISNLIINKDTSGIGIQVQANYVIVTNCDIKGYSKIAIGIQLNGHNNIIDECTIQRLDVSILVLVDSINNQIIGCNLLDNEKAIDIRINSNNNIITNSNVYGNVKGIYIWQSSNNNIIYHNNFWKNDNDAYDENDNQWDNGKEGNYWDDYSGIDTDNNGLGDTPFVISNNNSDRYPFIAMFRSDHISMPTYVKLLSDISDNTPTFMWGSSFYYKGIKGYYIKIDDNPEELVIGDLKSWSSPVPVSDGAHSFYVRGVGIDDTTSNYASITFIIDSTIIDSDQDGWSDKEEINFGTNPNDPNSYPLDTDYDHIPDSIDTDDDNDEISDEKETILGSNPKEPTDIIQISINGSICYLVDINDDGRPEKFYNPETNIITLIKYENSKYLIDINGDGSSDYAYNISDGSLSKYEEMNISWTLILWILIIIIIILILIIIINYLKNRSTKYATYKQAKKEPIERSIVRKPIRMISRDKDALKMIIETKDLLQTIQHEVKIYMDKLNQVNGRPMAPIPEEKKLPLSKKEQKVEEEDEFDINWEVDKILFLRYKNNDKNQ